MKARGLEGDLIVEEKSGVERLEVWKKTGGVEEARRCGERPEEAGR